MTIEDDCDNNTQARSTFVPLSLSPPKLHALQFTNDLQTHVYFQKMQQDLESERNKVRQIERKMATREQQHEEDVRK